MRLQGIAVSEGVGVGRARRLLDRLIVPERWVARGAEHNELHRLSRAVSDTEQHLAAAARQLERAGEAEGSSIAEAHRMLLRSSELLGAAEALIRGERADAASAVRRAVERLVARFEAMDDPYLRERGGDVDDVGQRLLAALLGRGGLLDGATRPGEIGIAWSISAIEAFRLPALRLAGLATARGGTTSHAAIAVRALGLPYAAAVRDVIDLVPTGTLVIVDGNRGEVIVDPDEETVRAYQPTPTASRPPVEAREPKLGMPAAMTRDGVEISLAANVDRLSELEEVVELGADSVGLLRTELLYLDRADLPTEDEQLEDAIAALRALGGRMATFRTLDIGGDKLPLAVPVPPCANPSLGVRGIRFSAVRGDIFRVQLRALYRASAVGPIRIMFPMISNVVELRDAVSICREVRDELLREGVPVGAHVPLGAMIETPSAALVVDHLAEICEFFSIGTNDLIQYAFAIDRENDDVAYLYHPMDPAVLRLLTLSISAATGMGRPIAICGDMAGQSRFTPILLGLGVRCLSMAPRHLPAVRQAVGAVDLTEAQRLAAAALELRSAHDVEAFVTRHCR